MNTTLEWARFYLSRGISIIPVLPKSKQPAILWSEFQRRHPTDTEIEKWFADGANHNIGIVTGSVSGLAVVDLDGDEAVKFARAHGFSPSPLVKTGRGYHVYYSYREGTRNFQKRDNLPGIDLRAEGGYVVAPPSIHESGVQYEWVKGKGLDDLEMAELPGIVLAEKPEQQKTPLRALYQGVSQGQRNDTLTRLVGSWANDKLTFAECLENALLWNSRNDPPLPEREIERTIKSIFEKHQRELSNCPVYIYKDSWDNTDNNEKSSTYEFDISKALRTGSELRNLNITVQWAVDKIIPLEAITLLSARGGMGKTTIALQLGTAITKGTTFFELQTKQLPVVYIDFEN